VNQMTKLYCWIMSGLKSEEGATMVEYGLMVALIAVALIGAIGVLAGGLGNIFNFIGGKLNGAAA